MCMYMYIYMHGYFPRMSYTSYIPYESYVNPNVINEIEGNLNWKQVSNSQLYPKYRAGQIT